MSSLHLFSTNKRIFYFCIMFMSDIELREYFRSFIYMYIFHRFIYSRPIKEFFFASSSCSILSYDNIFAYSFYRHFFSLHLLSTNKRFFFCCIMMSDIELREYFSVPFFSTCFFVTFTVNKFVDSKCNEKTFL